MKTLPQFPKKYFWDVDFSKLDKETHASFIIERILEEGDEKAARWMRDNLDPSQIKKEPTRGRSSGRLKIFFTISFMV